MSEIERVFQMRHLCVGGSWCWEASWMRNNPAAHRWEAVGTLATVQDDGPAVNLLVDAIETALKQDGWSSLQRNGAVKDLADAAIELLDAIACHGDEAAVAIPRAEESMRAALRAAGRLS